MDFSDEDDNSSSGSSSNGTNGGLLPSQVPVQTRFRRRDVDPTLRLTPGSHLEACNGNDIHLARGAIVPSSDAVIQPPHKKGKAAKTKHRYLVLWPGLLSLNPHRASETASPPNNSNSDVLARKQDPNDVEEKQSDDIDEEEKKEEKGDHEMNDLEEIKDDDDDDEEENDEEKTNKKASKTTINDATTSVVASTSTGSAVTTLGTLEGLDTETPTLKVPFPGGESLSFTGKKVQSSSKFMMLTCSKKGSVTCKNIFSSVVIFGDAIFHGKNIPKPVTATAGEVVVDSDDNDMDEDGETKPKAATNGLRHYGGSDRTVDGGKAAKGLKTGRLVLAPPARRRTKQVNNKEDEDENDSYDKGSSSDIARTPSTKKNKISIINNSDSDDDSDGDVELKADIVIPPKRNAPRRSASKKEIKYDIPSSSDEDEESSSGDEDQEGKSNNNKKVNSKAKKPAAAAKTGNTRKKQPATKDNAQKNTVTIDDSGDSSSGDDDDHPQEKTRPNIQTKKGVSAARSRASNGSRKATKEQDDVESDDEFQINLDTNDEADKPTIRVSSRRRSSSTKVQYVDLEESDDGEEDKSESENDSDASAVDDKKKKAKPKGKSNAIKRSSAATLSSSDESETNSRAAVAKAKGGKQGRGLAALAAAKEPIAKKRQANKTLVAAKKTGVGTRVSTGRPKAIAKKSESSDENSDGSDTDSLIKSIKAKATPKVTRRKSSAVAKKVTSRESSGSEDSIFEKGAAKRTGRNRVERPGAAKKTETITVDEDSETSIEEEKNENDRALLKKNRAAISKEASSPVSSTPKRKRKEESQDSGKGPNEKLKTPSPSPSIKRRRKSSSAKKGSSGKKRSCLQINDLTNDDEFTFLF